MTVVGIIEKILQEQNVSKSELARKLGTSRQNLSNKMSRDNFSVRELLEISAVLGTKLVIEDDKGGRYAISYEKNQSSSS